MERKFNVGDKVRVITNGNPCPKGTIGKVLNVDSVGAMLGFEEHFPRMHNGDGRVASGHGWYFLTHELVLVEPEVEKNPTFKIGDRVKAIATEDSDRIVGKTGTICAVPNLYVKRYGVRFDDCIKGHNCGGTCEEGYGWYVPGGKLVRLINEDKSLSKDWKVVIIPDGDKTLGRLYENGKVVKSVETKKHPDDEYSVETATKVIMERLFPEKEEVKPRFLEKFEKGKTYIFDYDTYKADGGSSTRSGYAGRIDGKTVDVKGDRDGGIEYFDILPEWCKEVESVKPVEPKEPPFKVGDVIELTEEFCGVPQGTKGEVLKIDSDGDLCVDFKFEYAGTHRLSFSLSTLLPKPTGLYVRLNKVKKVN